MQPTRFNSLKLLGGALIAAALPISMPRVGAESVPVLVTPVPAPSVTVPIPAEILALTVVARDGVKSDKPAIGQLDAGTVDSLSKPTIEQDFILRNDRKTPITIGRLQPTCGCTSVLLGEGGETTKTLAPGEEIKVRASVDVTRFHGPITKSVRAYAPDGTTLLATMEIKATIQDPITLSSRHLNFGQVKFGSAASRSLTVTLSPRVLAMGGLQLVSSNPDISVTPVVDKSDVGEKPAKRHYLVEISPKSAIGQVSSTLSFTVPAKNADVAAKTTAKDAASEETRLASSLQTTQIVISGEVVGKISATPKMIVFGASQQGPQQITVTGAPDLLKNLKFSSLSAWVKVNPVPAANPATNNAVFELTLDPRTPVGALETQVTITANDGERLNIPILADVPAAPKPAP